MYIDLNKKVGFSQEIQEHVVQESVSNQKKMVSKKKEEAVVEESSGTLRRWRCLTPAFFKANTLHKTASPSKQPSISIEMKRNLASLQLFHKRGPFTPTIATCERILYSQAEASVNRLVLRKDGLKKKQSIFPPPTPVPLEVHKL